MMSLKHLLPAGLLLFACLSVSTLAQAPWSTVSEAQAERERAFDNMLDPDNYDEWMKFMSSKPHHVGSPHSKANAEYMRDLFESWGYEAELAEYHVLFPTPKVRIVEMVAPQKYVPTLTEPALEEDATSGITKDVLPNFNSYSADGDVTAELVYVNQGIPRDYEVLKEMGIDVKGKVVIARYGGSWRGIKPKVAAENGALACILYSDPRDDGYFQGDVYPKGPYRNAMGAQRGSVSDMPKYPGDPLTPGVGATKDAERLSVEESETIMKIPVLPISYGDAQPLLEALGGPVAPFSWRGALPITYHIGPGPAEVRVHLEFNWDLAPAYNVIARMNGSTWPDEWVMRGNHHDGWTFGAADPISGMVSLLEEARAIGQLVKDGWRPKRTIVYAGWDAEEPGLLGSTEWAEHNASELKEKMVAYINTDGNGRGFLGAGGSHTLEKLVNQVARDVTDPRNPDVSLFDRIKARRMVNGDQEADTRADFRLYPLGSGSDYTPFIQHLGISALNLGFGGESGGGSYHSNYDSYDHFTKFVDPGFVFGRALTSTAGRVTMRLADADLLPHSFGSFADNVETYADQVVKLAESARSETMRHNRMVDEGLFEMAADPTKTFVAPTKRSEVPFMNFAPLQNAMARLKSAASSYDKAATTARVSPDKLKEVNRILLMAERSMTREEGLPRRPWFKHQIYAPGYYTGYGVKTLPGIREAIEQEDWEEAAAFIEIVAMTLGSVADDIERATAVLK